MVDLGELQKNLTKAKRDAKAKDAASKRAWENYRRAKSLANVAKDDVNYHADELTRATFELTAA